MIIDFPITLNLLMNFSKQASTVVASKIFTKVFPPSHLFKLFATLICWLYLRNYDANLCEIDAIILVLVVLCDTPFTTRTS